VLLDEGGDKLTDDPRDHGGRTKFGITQRLLTAILPGKIVDSLTEDEAKQIYWVHWWLEYRFGLLPERIGTKLFNFAVTAGPSPAFKCLQRAMRSNGMAVKDDGVMGPITRGLLTTFFEAPGGSCAEPSMMAALKSEMAGFYRDLDQPVFEAGWVNRAYRG
jgi:lysozyme family protein